MSLAIDHAVNVLTARLGAGWEPSFDSRGVNGTALRVLHRSGDPGELLVVRNDQQPAEGGEALGGGGFWYHSCWDDPALPGLRRVATEYQHLEVLRYRPGKRMTLRGQNAEGATVIVKCLRDDRAQLIFKRLCEVYRAREELEFEVSCPRLWNAQDFVLVQSLVAGVPLTRSRRCAVEVATAMAKSIASLHASSVMFPGRFTIFDQRVRSDRYAQLIGQRFPEAAAQVKTLMVRLGVLGAHVGRVRLKPIHGSLHSHQWLDQGAQLALIDFDRAAMGHVELDVATYLAERDYEPGNKELLQNTFLEAMPMLNPRLLCFYRAHKHLAKAFKASKLACPLTASEKTQRNLGRAIELTRIPL